MQIKPFDPIVSRIWAMPSKYTFQCRPLREVITRYKHDGALWADPFAGFYSPAELTNDLDKSTPALYHLEAIEFMRLLDSESVHGVIFDPPYSVTQVSRSYKDMGLQFKGKENPTGGFPAVRDEIRRVLVPHGYAISYGWNTVGMGIKRGFVPVEYLICSHGGNRNDTLVTVEQKCITDHAHRKAEQ